MEPDLDLDLHHDIAIWLRERTKFRPSVGIICGSGLGGLSNCLVQSTRQTIKYSDIPGFPESTVPGHAGELVFGELNGLHVVCMRGRFHSYEGYDIRLVALPSRVFRLLGAKLLLVTNAAGGLNKNYNVGDIMVMGDHFNCPGLAGKHPLVGANDDHLGPRFPALSDTYDASLTEKVLKAAKELGIEGSVRPNGTYCFVSGPSYETPLECQYLVNIGGDAVGMSTVPEVIAAKHCGMKVLGFSMITNQVVLPGDTTTPPPTHTEVLENISKATHKIESLVKTVVSEANLGTFLGRLPAAQEPLSQETRERKRLKAGRKSSGLSSPSPMVSADPSQHLILRILDRMESQSNMNAATGRPAIDERPVVDAGVSLRSLLVGVMLGVATSFAVRLLDRK